MTEPNQIPNSTPPEENQPEAPQDFKERAFSVFENLSEFLSDIFNIRTGLDRKGTVDEIVNNKEMKGSNVWLLVCSIMVASIGLDLNSQAVIIGAMLISPLMSPILGVGLGIGINDRSVLSISLKHLGVATVITLITSTLYFYLTPLGTATEQIIARTSPGFLDVLVAFFGGVAGIVSSSREEKSNAIPGVAIATALLPPLCSAGYGLANLDFHIFLNAFYLYFLNCVFVALATFLIIRLLKFPYKQYLREAERRKTQLYLSLFVFLVSIPSFFILYDVFQDLRYDQSIKSYVERYFDNSERFVVDQRILKTDSINQLLLTCSVDEYLSEKEIDLLQNEMQDFGIKKTELKIIQLKRNSDNDSEIAAIRQQLRDQENTVKNFEFRNQVTAEKEREIMALRLKIDSLQQANEEQFPISKSAQEIKALYPEIQSFGYATISQVVDDSTRLEIPTAFVKTKSRLRKREQDDLYKRLAEYLQIRYDLDTVSIMNFEN